MLRFIFLIDSGGGFLTGICFLGNGLFFLAWEFSPRTSSIWFLQKVQETKTYWTLTGVNYQSITAKSIHLLTVFRMWNKNTTASSTCFEQRTVLFSVIQVLLQWLACGRSHWLAGLHCICLFWDSSYDCCDFHHSCNQNYLFQNKCMHRPGQHEETDYHDFYNDFENLHRWLETCTVHSCN